MNVKTGLKTLALTSALAATPLMAADYVIDTQGAHAFVQFKISHLGYSYVLGRFNDFEGNFTWDKNNPEASSIEVNIDPASVDTNHAERDQHIRSDDFLDVSNYAQASFVSTGYEVTGEGEGVMTGDLTLMGETRSIEIDVEKVGEGEDPWGGYRVGFTGTTEIHLPDYGINFNLGPAAETVEMELVVEGVRQ
ncbi:YceI family protein [Marinospirillum perlucidum]|uniref:YceI family protein n=1 Tax=Marinospirillum perlucidum TaxID=1982602 RepID=UPI000DF33C44|nr:YceI family protein [Marinospirillum perlucidum]